MLLRPCCFCGYDIFYHLHSYIFYYSFFLIFTTTTCPRCSSRHGWYVISLYFTSFSTSIHMASQYYFPILIQVLKALFILHTATNILTTLFSITTLIMHAHYFYVTYEWIFIHSPPYYIISNFFFLISLNLLSSLQLQTIPRLSKNVFLPLHFQ